MGKPAEWLWDEFAQVGTDYAAIGEVERYEQRMSEVRDLAAEDADILTKLSLPKSARILEVGTGTGHFALAAARAGYYLTALDVSPTMPEYARSKAVKEGVSGISFVHAGFLTLSSAPATFDAAVSVAALHHLPDLWKAVALNNVRRALKTGGRFLLRDVVFSWQADGHAKCFDGFVSSVPAGMCKETVRHIAKEYSTLTWILEGLLEHAGFRIKRIATEKPSLAEYLCLAAGYDGNGKPSRLPKLP